MAHSRSRQMRYRWRSWAIQLPFLYAFKVWTGASLPLLWSMPDSHITFTATAVHQGWTNSSARLLRWLISVDPQHGTDFMSRFWCTEFWGGSYISRKFVRPCIYVYCSMADNVLSFQKCSMKYSTYFTKIILMGYKTKNAVTRFSPRRY